MQQLKSSAVGLMLPADSALKLKLLLRRRLQGLQFGSGQMQRMQLLLQRLQRLLLNLKTDLLQGRRPRFHLNNC